MGLYDTYYDIAQAGQFADSCAQRDVITRPNNNTPLDFGVPVRIITPANTATGSSPVVTLGGSDDTIIGISVFKQPCEPSLSGSMITYQYKPNEPVSILTNGRIYVKVDMKVAPYDIAYIDLLGRFTNVDSDDNQEFGVFTKGANAGGLAVLQFSLSAYAVAGGL